MHKRHKKQFKTTSFERITVQFKVLVKEKKEREQHKITDMNGELRQHSLVQINELGRQALRPNHYLSPILQLLIGKPLDKGKA